MAVSPLPAKSPRNGAISKSKLSGSALPSNGVATSSPKPANGAGLDVAELMNDEEKSKYVKGYRNVPESFQRTNSLQARKLERERMPTSIWDILKQTHRNR